MQQETEVSLADVWSVAMGTAKALKRDEEATVNEESR